MPVVGRIKKIDFFINNKPFDLKVTYLPEGYVKDYRNANRLRPELTLMKRACRELDIGFEQSAPDAELIPDLWKKLDDHPSARASSLMSELRKCREKLLKEVAAAPKLLTRWLYENQGARRFDATNRLFLVLVDKKNFFDSWKLKRARPLIAENVAEFLDASDNEIGFRVDFQWEANVYTAEADLVLIVK